jgi:hypothetical protein
MDNHILPRDRSLGRHPLHPLRVQLVVRVDDPPLAVGLAHAKRWCALKRNTLADETVLKLLGEELVDEI